MAEQIAPYLQYGLFVAGLIIGSFRLLADDAGDLPVTKKKAPASNGASGRSINGDRRLLEYRIGRNEADIEALRSEFHLAITRLEGKIDTMNMLLLRNAME